MFKGKYSVLKNGVYLALLGVHAVLFIIFLSSVFLSYPVTIASSLTILCLEVLAFYSFLTNKSYYYYFYLGMIVCSFPVIFVVLYGAILVVPELIFLVVLLFYERGYSANNQKMRVSKKANFFTIALRTGQVWNPGSSVQTPNTEVKINRGNIIMGIIAFLLTIVLFIGSMLSVYDLYYIAPPPLPF